MVYRFMVGLSSGHVASPDDACRLRLYDGLQRLHGHAFERRPLPELEPWSAPAPRPPATP